MAEGYLVTTSEIELEECEKAREILSKNGMRRSLPYWILLHAHNRIEKDSDELWLRVARSSREWQPTIIKKPHAISI